MDSLVSRQTPRTISDDSIGFSQRRSHLANPVVEIPATPQFDAGRLNSTSSWANSKSKSVSSILMSTTYNNNRMHSPRMQRPLSTRSSTPSSSWGMLDASHWTHNNNNNNSTTYREKEPKVCSPVPSGDTPLKQLMGSVVQEASEFQRKTPAKWIDTTALSVADSLDRRRFLMKNTAHVRNQNLIISNQQEQIKANENEITLLSQNLEKSSVERENLDKRARKDVLKKEMVIHTFATELREVKEENQRLKSEMGEFMEGFKRKTVQSPSDKVHPLQQQLETLEFEIASLKEKNSNSLEKIHSLEAALEAKNKQHEHQIKMSRADLENEVKALESACRLAEENYRRSSTLAQQLTVEKDELEHNIRTLRHELHEHKTKAQAAEQSLNLQKNTQETLDKLLMDAKSSLSAYTSRVEMLEIAMKEKERQKEDESRVRNRLQLETEELKRALVMAQADAQHARAQLSTTQFTVQKLERELQLVTDERNRLHDWREMQEETKKSIVEETVSRLNKAEDTVSQLRSTVAGALEKSDFLQSQNDSLQSTNSLLRTTMSDLNIALAKAEQKEITLNAIMAEMKKEQEIVHTSFREQLFVLESECTSLKRALKDANSGNESASYTKMRQEKEIQQLREELAKLVTSLRKADNTITQLTVAREEKDVLSEHCDRCDKLMGEVDRQRSTAQDLRRKTAELLTEKESHDMEVEALKSKIATLESERDYLVASTNKMKQQIQQQSQQQQSQQQPIHPQQQSQQQSQQQQSQQQPIHSQQQSQQQQPVAPAPADATEIADLKKQIFQLKQDNEELQDQLENLREIKEYREADFEEQLNGYREQIAELEAQLK